MTIRVPRIALILLGLVAAGASGAVVGWWIADSERPRQSVTTPVRVETSTVTDFATTTRTVETTPVEALAGLPGGQVIQDLINQDVIDQATPREPPADWESEFKLDRGEVVIRFRDDEIGTRHVEWNYSTTAEGREVHEAIDAATTARGYVLE